jgi:phenylalanyl-tRNA synthetase alpha chain
MADSRAGASSEPGLTESILRAVETLRAQFSSRFAAAPSEQALREENAKILGPKGELTAILKQLSAVAPESRRAVGEKVNLLKREIAKAFEESLAALVLKERQAELTARPFDLTLPGRPLAPIGHKHPVSIVQEEITDIFQSLGFAVHDGPEVELEENNFTKLGFPPDHPATDMQDSFWTTSGYLLRTHTSNVQIRAMSTHKPPMAFVAPGAVYRRDNDVTHSPMFHQVEGFLVDDHVTFADLKGVLTEFAQRLFGEGTPVRFRPSYFPFTEPSAEVDIGCVFCRGDAAARATCALCKRTGWIEILGSGMIHPVVLEHCGIDAEKYMGFAFGIGVERVAFLRYGVPDIRMFFENDPRLLAQF